MFDFKVLDLSKLSEDVCIVHTTHGSYKIATNALLQFLYLDSCDKLNASAVLNFDFEVLEMAIKFYPKKKQDRSVVLSFENNVFELSGTTYEDFYEKVSKFLGENTKKNYSLHLAIEGMKFVLQVENYDLEKNAYCNVVIELYRDEKNQMYFNELVTSSDIFEVSKFLKNCVEDTTKFQKNYCGEQLFMTFDVERDYALVLDLILDYNYAPGVASGNCVKVQLLEEEVEALSNYFQWIIGELNERSDFIQDLLKYDVLR